MKRFYVLLLLILCAFFLISCTGQAKRESNREKTESGYNKAYSDEEEIQSTFGQEQTEYSDNGTVKDSDSREPLGRTDSGEYSSVGENNDNAPQDTDSSKEENSNQNSESEIVAAGKGKFTPVV